MKPYESLLHPSNLTYSLTYKMSFLSVEQQVTEIIRRAIAEKDLTKRIDTINEVLVFYINHMNDYLENMKDHRNIVYERCGVFLTDEYCTPTLAYNCGVLRKKIEQLRIRT